MLCPGREATLSTSCSQSDQTSTYLGLGMAALVAAPRGPSLSIMASAPTVLFLGCWLAGHSGVWGGYEFPKPVIWVSPSRVVGTGENVTIHCEGQYPGMEFILHKSGHQNLQQQVVPAGTMAEFPLRSVSQGDAGSYTCKYHRTMEPSRWSHPSDNLELVVAEPSEPKPSISLNRSEGVTLRDTVTIWCQGQRRGRRFVLKTEGGHFLYADPDGFEAEFLLSNLSREQGGSYSCFYRSRSEPFTVSYPSDPVELVLRDPSLPRPSISLRPTWVTTPGEDITIWCQGPGRDMRFFLHPPGNLEQQRPMDPAEDGAEFHIHPVGQQHGGSYSCSYRPRSEPFVSSQLSDPVELVVVDYTRHNIIRLALAAGVLLGLALILAEAAHGWRRGTHWKPGSRCAEKGMNPVQCLL
nr:immunoglobulin superfamily member 1-like isoform X3 [Pelodiscus sinensis]|eukprot:XP_025037208.1 immunoglobulin superfamily member 1-like isoform X3 [Pelodiscus sinensis]